MRSTDLGGTLDPVGSSRTLKASDARVRIRRSIVVCPFLDLFYLTALSCQIQVVATVEIPKHGGKI